MDSVHLRDSEKTATQRAENELIRSEEQFRLLVDGVKDYAILKKLPGPEWA
jgi:hypothetical protein